jgi:hypothetical protein
LVNSDTPIQHQIAAITFVTGTVDDLTLRDEFYADGIEEFLLKRNTDQHQLPLSGFKLVQVPTDRLYLWQG